MPGRDFRSDNAAGAAPEILAALERSAAGSASPYGGDDLTRRVGERFAELFEREVEVLPLVTGTAANSLGLALLTPPWGAVYCHREAHVHVDECGAPEMFTAGAKLIPLPGEHGKIDPDTLAGAISRVGDVHSVQPAALSLSQATEAGTVYRPGELRALAAVAEEAGIGVQMDGARFANAVVGAGASPAELTWRAGLDVLAFGATKNGALGAEAVVLFRPGLGEELRFRAKRSGHLLSKMRFVAAQLDAYLEGGLWRRLAERANATAARLAEGLAERAGLELLHPVEANELFVRLPVAVAEALEAAGFAFYRWPDPEAAPGAAPGAAPEAGERSGSATATARLVCSFDTADADVDALVEVAAAATA